MAGQDPPLLSHGVGSVKVVHSVSTDNSQERLDSHLLQRAAEGLA
jgi:hypothetical protein